MIEQFLIIRCQARNGSFAKYPLRKRTRTGGFGFPARDAGFGAGPGGSLNAGIDEEEVGSKGTGIVLNVDETGILQLTARSAHCLRCYAEFFCQRVDAGIARPGSAVHHVSQHDKQPNGCYRQTWSEDKLENHP